ncbi:copper homeostasis protein CutC [Gluconacetobacter aggeris]|uniref:PF03932 family protein CutC n=1 Tax=Gluconacetobacter aggeris TaxID=1286186 RepID=A0A7W4NWE8_9PROT|nr:copper homeostasis protein CutC [Gluconacetobacter aggeris]MBB2168761.1 copper homeostasis protein CutC [Gluconacetobacter aggeris]
MHARPILLEVCVDGAEGLEAAVAGGADRVELCAALALGGLTPSAGLMAIAARVSCPVLAMIRPRPGDFVFSSAEEEVMRGDIAAVARAGLSGIVLGACLADGRLDEAMLRRLLDHARACGLSRATLHRAFDQAVDPDAALEVAVGLGFERILTSGGGTTAWEGRERLRRLADRAGGRISVMAGGGVSPLSAAALVAATGVKEIHGSCRSGDPPRGQGARHAGFGDNPVPTDAATVRAIRRVLDSAGRVAPTSGDCSRRK